MSASSPLSPRNMSAKASASWLISWRRNCFCSRCSDHLLCVSCEMASAHGRTCVSMTTSDFCSRSFRSLLKAAPLSSLVLSHMILRTSSGTEGPSHMAASSSNFWASSGIDPTHTFMDAQNVLGYFLFRRKASRSMEKRMLLTWFHPIFGAYELATLCLFSRIEQQDEEEEMDAGLFCFCCSGGIFLYVPVCLII
ncbi:hypothetical protein Mapa_014012 [Marchantia paleacea]|nr:hypothetical protein Mapa_014012 [Marchantia paleacea]